MNCLNLSLLVFLFLSLIITQNIIRILIENDANLASIRTRSEIFNLNSNISKFLSRKIYINYLSNDENETFRTDDREINSKSNECNMEQCFNFTKCSRDFKIFVYEKNYYKTSKVYKEILKIFNGLPYRTEDPNEACLFVPSIDTLDRDKLSKNNINNIKNVIDSLKYWNNGKNHVIFNFYSGTWPNYDHYYELLSTNAIIAKASFHATYYRNNFDVSFPLFHSELPYSTKSLEWHGRFASKKYLFTFKGKRYLTGIRSDTRNNLHHLNNDRDILILTTCRHGSDWQELKDERCDSDEEQYQKYDYNELILNSTFCLIPRGRRLGTFRFLEVLKQGCIPVILSNNWVLPFSEVLDWSRAVIWADERKLTDIPFILRNISHKTIFQMQQQAIFYFNTYFSSVERIVMTTIEIIKGRVNMNQAYTKEAWNNYPGIDLKIN